MKSEYVQSLKLLLTGISLHAIEDDPDHLQELQKGIASVTDSIGDESTPDDLLVNVQKVIRAVETYNHKASQSLKQQAAELRTTTDGMTQTIAFLGSSCQMSVAQLQTLEQKLHRVSGLEDSRQIKAQVGACVDLVRTEMTRVKAESKARIEALQSEIARLAAKPPAASSDGSTDPVTGLPARQLAEDAITAKILSGREFAAAIFVVDRVASINGRFGRLAGDEVLIAAARHIVQRLTGVSLFRWTGPAFVALIEQAGNLAASEDSLRQAGAMRLEKSVEAGNRSAMLMVTCSTQVHKLTARTPAEVVFREMDGFLASHFTESPE